MPVYKGNSQTQKVLKGSTPVQRIYVGNNIFFEQGTPPTIQSFTSDASTIDLDTTLRSRRVHFSFSVANSTHNAITNKRTGMNIPLNTSGTAVINIPNQTTTYVLTASNENGAISSEVTITVTKNPTIMNLRRTGFTGDRLGGTGGTYRFGAIITGLPRPTLRYQFSTGESGTLTTRHLTQGGTPYKWILSFTHYFGLLNPRNLTVTATNASGTASATIINILN